jgi:hypothetical protein
MAWLGAPAAGAQSVSAVSAGARDAQSAGAAAAAPNRLVVSVGAGVLVPGDQVVGDVYGSAMPAVAIEAEIPIGSWFRACAGARFAWADGTTISETPGAAVDLDEVTLRTWTIRAGGEVSRRLANRVRWFAGVAGAFGQYREEWTSASLTAEGNLAGVAVAGGLHYEFARRFGIVGRVEYSMLRASEIDPEGEKPDLGGLELSAGVSVRF